GQEAAVQLGAEKVAPHGPLGAVLPVVAAPPHHAAERTGLLAQEGAAAVVLEADEGRRLQAQRGVGLHHNVPNAASLARLGPHVEESDARKALALGGVVVV